MRSFLALGSVRIFIYGEQNIMSFIPERAGFAQERPKRPLIELNIVADRLHNGGGGVDDEVFEVLGEPPT